MESDQSSDSEAPSTPHTEPAVDEITEAIADLPAASISVTANPRTRRASTTLISQNTDDIRRILGDQDSGTKLIQKFCCGGGCCLTELKPPAANIADFTPITTPDNLAFKSFGLKLGALAEDTELTGLAPFPGITTFLEQVPSSKIKHETTVYTQPPPFVQPHPPHGVFSAPVFGARALTKAGAEKRTYHFDIDVTDYPIEDGLVDFKVGGAIGVCPPNDSAVVDDIFQALGVPSFIRDKSVLLRTTTGRWPTIWGDDQAREVITTRRELLTWCCDLESSPPTKALLRLMAEYADAPNEKKILEYLVSAEGQAAFCDLRTDTHITLAQLLYAFPSSKPPLASLFSVSKQLMPRFYSLSNDPHVSSAREGLAGRRLIEMAVSVHESPDWRGGSRTGAGSGYLERVARKFMEAEVSGCLPATALDIKIPMFRGLMANPLSKEFTSDGPMMLIGAGVGMAPFRGFILNRLKNANCANKIWLVQGVRDSMLDEIYSGELGDHEQEIKHVVQSRKASKSKDGAKYVQDEVRVQADIVWYVINALDGRVFVCGSSKGMGEGVHSALVDVSMEKGGLNRDQAQKFWESKKEGGQYIAVSTASNLPPLSTTLTLRAGNLVISGTWSSGVRRSPLSTLPQF
jgi:sulfite reductase alpha subunit-like flavoprotein